MSLVNLNGTLIEIPNLSGRSGGAALSTVTLNATGETMHQVGEIYFAGGYTSASKTISAAGGGKIIWASGAVTFANAGTTFKVGIEDVSAVSNPAQGDGTLDVYTSFTGGGGGITASAVQTSTMTSGTKSLTWGQQVAITFEMTAMAGADSVAVGHSNPARGQATWGFPMCSDNTGGSYARTSSAFPNAIIQFDDGTYGYIVGTQFVPATSSNLAFALDTGTADEYGNIYNLRVARSIIGFVIDGYPQTSAAADAEVILYSDPLGTPVAERAYTWDATISQGSTSGEKMGLFSTPYRYLPGVPIMISVRATVNAQSVRLYYNNMPTEAVGNIFGYGQYCYAARRLNNSGAFADYNGGTAKTRYMGIALLVDTSGQDSHFAHSQIGM